VLDGASLVPLLRGTGGLQREAIFWHYPVYLEPYNDSQWPWRATPAGAVRKGDWKLIEFFEDQRLELYNLKEDIGEKDNRAAAMPEKAKELHALLVRCEAVRPGPRPQFDPRSLRSARRIASRPEEEGETEMILSVLLASVLFVGAALRAQYGMQRRVDAFASEGGRHGFSTTSR
jgi:hypothetical protein